MPEASPLAHAGHVILDLILYLGPVLAIGIAVLVANIKARKEQQGKAEN